MMRDIEQFYSTQIEEMPMSVAESSQRLYGANMVQECCRPHLISTLSRFLEFARRVAVCLANRISVSAWLKVSCSKAIIALELNYFL